MRKILAIIGSASENSSNERLIELIKPMLGEAVEVHVLKHLKTLPHFDPELSIADTPQAIVDVRNAIDASAGVLICTPEYVFSIPSGLKNLIEWCVSTTIFTNKPTALITASADGRKGHDELKLIMSTVMANFSESTTLLIPGVKGKFDKDGNLLDSNVQVELEQLAKSFLRLMERHE
jgi:chromate reductase, NAD(P)H dehydrogenase (quinone)